MSVVISSVPRRQLGRLLREARERAGMSVNGAARSLEWSTAKMYRVESGEAPMRTHDVTVMCALFDVAPDLREVMTTLAKEAKEGSWWHAYGETIPAWFELYMGMEAYAVRLRHYETGLIPGLFQTPDYAEEVLRQMPNMSEDRVASQIAIRMERQKILTRRSPVAPRVEVLLDEYAIRRPLKNRDLWRAQLIRLRETATLRNVSLRILPLDLQPYPAKSIGSFVIMEFLPLGLRTPEPSTVYCEGLTGALYLDRPTDVAAYEGCWQNMIPMAMSATDTTELLSTLIKEYE